MVFGLPTPGEPNWDVKLDASIEAVKTTADAAEAEIAGRLSESSLTASIAPSATLDGRRFIMVGDSRGQAYDAEGTATVYQAFRATAALLLMPLSHGAIRLQRNASHGGYTSAQMRALFDDEVLIHDPTLVGFLFGRNDGQADGTPADYIAAVEEMIDKAHAQGCGVFVCNTTPQGQAELSGPANVYAEQVTTASGTRTAGTRNYAVSAGVGSATVQSGETIPTPAAEFTTVDTGTEEIWWDHVPGANWYGIYEGDGTTTTYVEATNYSANPSWEQIGTGNGGSNGTGGTAANSRPTDGGHFGTTYLRRTWSVGTTAVSGGVSGAKSNAFPTGGRFCGRTWVRSSRKQRIQGSWTFYDGGDVVGSHGVTKVIEAGTWTAFEAGGVTMPATANAALFAATAVSGVDGVNWQDGDTLDIDDEFIAPGETLPATNFNGDTTDTATVAYDWTGTAGTSTSTKTVTVPNYKKIATVSPSFTPGFFASKRYVISAPTTLGADAPTANTTGLATSLNAEAARLNAATALLCAKKVVPMVDIYTALVDPLTGRWKKGYTFDGTHPTGRAHQVIAETIWATIGPLVKKKPALLTSSQLDTGLNLNPSPLFNDGGNAPRSWTVNVNLATWEQRYVTHELADVTGILGKSYRQTATRPVLDGANSATISTGFSPGDRLYVAFHVDVALKAGGGSYDVQLQDSAGALIAQARFVDQDIAGPVVFDEVVVPAGVTGLKLVTTSSGMGPVSIGQWTVYNQTTNAWLAALL